MEHQLKDQTVVFLLDEIKHLREVNKIQMDIISKLSSPTLTTEEEESDRIEQLKPIQLQPSRRNFRTLAAEIERRNKKKKTVVLSNGRFQSPLPIVFNDKE